MTTYEFSITGLARERLSMIEFGPRSLDSTQYFLDDLHLVFEGEVYEIYLRPEYQGIGLGRILFGEAKSLLKSLGCKGLVVWCLEDSHHADRFFRMAGGHDVCEGMEDFGGKCLKKIGYIWD